VFRAECRKTQPAGAEAPSLGSGSAMNHNGLGQRCIIMRKTFTTKVSAAFRRVFHPAFDTCFPPCRYCRPSCIRYRVGLVVANLTSATRKLRPNQKVSLDDVGKFNPLKRLDVFAHEEVKVDQ
jgi:hypothetical protein